MMRMLVLAVLLSAHQHAGACQCQPSDLDSRFRQSDAVFVGTVMRHAPLEFVELNVVSRFKGSVPDRVSIITGRGDCDYFLPPVYPKLGDRYLLFVSVREGLFTASRCLGSAPEAKAEQDLARLRQSH